MDALRQGRFAWVCVGIVLGRRLQLLPSPRRRSGPPPPPKKKSLTPAGKNINERICGKKRKVNESGEPPSASGPGSRKEAKGDWVWAGGKVLGDAAGGDPGTGAGRAPGHCSQPGLISREPVSCARGAWMHLGIAVYIYIVCDAKSRSGGGGSECGGGQTEERERRKR